MSKLVSNLISKYPKIILLIFSVILFFSISNLNNFKLDASSDSLVLESDDDLKYYREVNSDYSSSDFLIIIFDPKKDLFSDEAISQVREMVDAFEKIDGSLFNYGIGFIAAFVTGLIACTWMIKLVKSSQLKYFSIYCFIVAGLTLFLNLYT